MFDVCIPLVFIVFLFNILHRHIYFVHIVYIALKLDTKVLIYLKINFR